MGEGGVTVCSSGGFGGGLRPSWPPRHCTHHRGLLGRVCPQEPGILAEEKGRLGKMGLSFLTSYFLSPITIDICIQHVLSVLFQWGPTARFEVFPHA